MAPASEGIYRANLEKLPPDLIKLLKDHPEVATPVEHDVQVAGLKNPICVCIIGFATSRVLEELLKSKKQVKHIIVIEPSLGRFHATVKRHYLGGLLSDKRIDWLLDVPQEELQVHLYKIFCKFDHEQGPRAGLCHQPEIIYDPFVYGKGGTNTEAELQLITQAVTNSTKQVFMAMGCSSDSFNRWIQSGRNFDNLFKSYNGKALEGKFADVPAIVLGAGPSLDQFISFYKEHKIEGEALIIACDASLRRLLKEGIRPHIVTRCERKLTAIFDGVEKKDTKGIIYAYYPWCDPEFVENFEESMVLYRDNGLCLWTELDHLRCNGGVSSANAGLELAVDLGCRNIVLSGVDLCFLDGKSHTDGTMVEFDLDKSKPLWSKIKSNSGKEVTTIPVWFRCLSEYQSAIVKYHQKRQVKIYNTSMEGVVINGTEAKPWNELSHLFKSDQFVRQKLSKNLVKYQPSDREAFDSRCKKTIDDLLNVKAALVNVFRTVDDAMATNKMEEDKALIAMKHIDDIKEYDRLWRAYTDSLANIYKPACKVIDEFKMKWFMDKLFSNTILDTCQLDTFKNENKVNGLKNTEPSDFLRLKSYIKLHCDLFRQFEYYINKTISILKGEQPALAITNSGEDDGDNF